MICLICQETRPPETQAVPTMGYLCMPHCRKIHTLLWDIVRRTAHLLDPQTMINTRDQDAERWVGGRAPCDTTPLSLTDRRTIARKPGDPISAERVLRAWYIATLDEFGLPGYSHDRPMPRVALGTLVGLIVLWLPYLVTTTAIVRFARHVAAVHRALERQTPDF